MMKLIDETLIIEKDDKIYENNIEKSRIIIKDNKNNILNIYSWCLLGFGEHINEVLIKTGNKIKEYSIENCEYADLITMFGKAPTEAPKKVTKNNKKSKKTNKGQE